MKTNTLKTKLALALALVAGTVATQAAITTFTAPAFRGQANTSAAYWDFFTTGAYNTTLAPHGIPAGGLSLANATLIQYGDANAFVTGSGNIYNAAGTNKFSISYSGGSQINEVVFQTRTAVGGNLMDYNSIQLTYDIGGGLTSLGATRTALTDAGGGDSSRWSWDLSSITGLNSFNILFNAADMHSSFDSAMVDVAAVPEPSTYALLGLAGAGLISRRFFRRQSR